MPCTVVFVVVFTFLDGSFPFSLLCDKFVGTISLYSTLGYMSWHDCENLSTNEMSSFDCLYNSIFDTMI